MTRRLATTLLTSAVLSPAAPFPMLTISSPEASVSFDLRGGSLVDFHLTGSTVNPFTWVQNVEPKEEPLRGHFVCLDRWGAPSEAEIARGVPYHGEAPRVLWKATGPRTMTADLPIANLGIEREATLTGATLIVRERVTNRNPTGRIYNMVQHPTIAPPFLDEQTFIDANAGLGFAQTTPNQAPQPFPKAHTADLRHLTSDPLPNVVSYIIEGPTGWVTAASPTSGLVLAYLWKTSEYPWLNLWRDVAKGRPIARGLEFGSTGLHQPYPELIRRGRMLDRPLFSYLDAGESVERSYTVSLSLLPAGTKRITQVQSVGPRIDLKFD
ncbi:MAG: hypothetical protein NTV52_08035 [Acidobacteria bacterium]|nr:hypothetical protein [Acidobacteriota bacterium]